MTMRKDLNYYLDLPYKIEIVPISDSDGGGFTAHLPQIGRYAIVGDGETIEDAITDLHRVKKARFAEYLGKGVEIPEPLVDDGFGNLWSPVCPECGRNPLNCKCEKRVDPEPGGICMADHAIMAEHGQEFCSVCGDDLRPTKSPAQL